ncbi:tetratricopeptide repeat protein [Streptomyces sp. TLI_171]|uniref:tetratricopeptide repeat protein n=1 Tax=Streptomyces sp. TLI_171 TaxID=1938859 RepID=UPI000C192A6E|nr:tetratricopeptide repeat protein [Streptomyces sp. TLI_171]
MSGWEAVAGPRPDGDGAQPAAGLCGAGRLSISADHGSIAAYRIDGPVTVHQHPPSAAAPAPRPVRVGVVPSLASAFQPRDGLRGAIDRARAGHPTVVLTQVLSGGGGVGKSQLAASYAHHAHSTGVDVLVWVDAAETAQIIAAFAEAAGKVGAPGADGQDAEGDAAAFLAWLAVTERSWLVVLDDLADLENSGRWWPRPPADGKRGRVLATTRRRGALLSGAGRALVDVGLYDLPEALGYLRERLDAAGAAHLLGGRAAELVEALGLLPLALAHAAAYMINEDVDCGAYLDLFSDRASRLDAVMPADADADGYGRQVTASLLVALDAAQRREPVGLAAPAIRLAALLDPAGHPGALWTTRTVARYLTDHRAPHPSGSATAAAEPFTPARARAAVRLLHQYGLLTSDSRDGHRAVRMHALTARAARESAVEADASAALRAAASALREIWPEHTRTVPDLAAVLRSNAETLAAHADGLLWQSNAHLVLFAAGNSLIDDGFHAGAVDHWRRLAADAGRVLGEQHPHAVAARGQLANAYQHAGRVGEALVLEERVAADSERLLGSRHPDTLTARHNLALSDREAGRIEEAVRMLQEVAVDSERSLGEQHPRTLVARAQLAVSYHLAGRTDEAVSLLEQVVADTDRALGEHHPHALAARANLATAYRDAGRTAQALRVDERVAADTDRLLGSLHPDTLTVRNNLANSYLHAGRTEEALDLLEQVAADTESVRGGRHPDTLTARSNLAIAYWEDGRSEEALDLLEQVVVDRERTLGERHPDTLISRHHLAAARRQRP